MAKANVLVSGKAGVCAPRTRFEPQHSRLLASENKGACSGNMKLTVSETSTFCCGERKFWPKLS